MSPWTSLDSNKEQHPFLYRSRPKMDNFQSKTQHRATAAATVAIVVAVAAQIAVSFQKSAVREPPDLQIDTHFLWRVTFLLHQFLGILRFLMFSYFVCTTGLQTAPKMGSISGTSDLAQV